MSGVEAQKIVAVSLSKIAASRATRSGINLYKSLMVSSVLYKARTVVIMEKYNGPSQPEQESPKVPEEQESLESNLQTTDIDDYEDDQDNNSSEESEEEDSEDKENCSVSEDNEIQQTSKLTQEDNNSKVICNPGNSQTEVLKSCENTTQNLDNNEITKCERCTKRRITELDCAVESILPKKFKSSEEQEEKEHYNSENQDNEQQSVSEPMEGIQITQLVDSFTGLLSSACSNSNQGIENSSSSTHVLKSSDQNSFLHVSKSSCSKSTSHGLSEAFNHCSTQIKESYDTLSSPILALGITV